MFQIIVCQNLCSNSDSGGSFQENCLAVHTSLNRTLQEDCSIGRELREVSETGADRVVNTIVCGTDYGILGFIWLGFIWSGSWCIDDEVYIDFGIEHHALCLVTGGI